MSGIDRSDSIRRPVDSTLSTRTAHRGGEGLLQPQQNAMAQLRQSAPAIAVVVEQHNLGTPRKPLFELLLSMNDQWVRVQSTKPFQPGTVLLIEATSDDQIRVLPNPEPAQLNRMMQASLQFWQAHTLPRVHATSLPPLPATSSQQQVAAQQPELKPLIDWLNQKPALNARTLANWVREFMPLAMPTTPAGTTSTPPAKSALPPVPWPSASLQATGNGNSVMAAGDKTAPPASPVQSPTTGQATTATAPLRILVETIRATLPILQQAPLRWMPVQQQASGQWQPVQHPGTAKPMIITASTDALFNRVVPEALVAVKNPATPAVPVAVPYNSLLATPPEAPSQLRLQLVDARILQQPQPRPVSFNQNLTPPLLAALSTLPTRPAPAMTLTVTPTLLPPTTSLQQATVNFSVTTAAADAALPVSTTTALPTSANDPGSDWRPLPSRSTGSDPLPLEMRLAQWLMMIDNRIRQHPASLQQSLAQRAQQLLRSNDLNYGLDKPLPPPPLPSIHNNTVSNPANQQSLADLQPLMQLRQWLEAVQGKTQNNAIQQTLSALTQGGDGPSQPVQQLSIPLIWMGPSSWANLEWWQEKPSDTEEEASSGGKRLWRFRLFFELEPLAPLCADLVWEPEQTDLTFWSEDRNTLAFLKSHLSTLEQWTEGLGERQLHTRHGMPRKKSTPEADDFKPLVDVHT
ncbi:hypothetical protein BGP77_03680 [Saccharospirillum sp. MSK14-1]|uniref:hypothetical protein n=1 Tax=Saccharospirillum sp. MSK14-1 TaxID=1897632 RepID=UPI000D35EA83|nr:hypothetical protein [Saccharospirillum sp. MSK14-1]PTY36410.1 hypothetical protein BGP77_03680 [Saccharospirillum sp. MSK14-1]